MKYLFHILFIAFWIPLKTNNLNQNEWVLIKGGEFMMGNQIGEGRDNEFPPVKVSLHDFYMARYEVTNMEFCEFLNAEGNRVEGGRSWLDIVSPFCNIQKVQEKFVPKNGKANHPVVEVSWFGAKAYAKWKNARLPSEMEWEYVASSKGRFKKYPTGKSISHEVANIKGIGGVDTWDGTSPVGSFSPNELGIYDLAGNVWEWCEDKYKLHHTDTVYDPYHAVQGYTRVVKGGSWSFGKEHQRINYRARQYAAYRSYDNGFRLARDADGD